jgi:HEAT repeat protein
MKDLMSASKNELVRGLIRAKLDRDAEHLMNALRDPEVRGMAARYLAIIGARESIPQLTRLLSVADPGARSGAIKALTKLGAGDVLPDLIMMATNDPSPVVRSHAVGAMRRLGDPPVVVPVLLNALRDSDGGVSACAAEELGAIADASAIEPIKAAAVGAHLLRRGAYRGAIRRIRMRAKCAPRRVAE